MTYQIEKAKWIFYRHTRDLDKVAKVAQLIKTLSQGEISQEARSEIQDNLAEEGLYNERNTDRPLDSINHKINTLCNYMFGYKDTVSGKEKFIYSPLGNLYLKNLEDKDKLKKIFLSMLWAEQFEHPHGGSDPKFQLYPFRLIYKLLLDSRLDYTLYSLEIEYIVIFTENIDDDSYEHLVAKILEYRKKEYDEKFYLLKNNEHIFVNSVYEWDYYTMNILADRGVLDVISGEVIGRLNHGKSTKRKVTTNSFKIPNDLKDFIIKLNEEYPFTERPLQLNDDTRLKIDVVKEIYSFYPRILTESIGEFNKEIENVLELPKLIEKYAQNEENQHAYLFEDVLEEGFNMFHNVDAKKIGGAGKPDLECLYISKKKKFSVDAKSTSNKLSSINSRRIEHHKDIVGGKYAIVVTPKYVPAVKTDIKGSNIVVVLASTFSEYLYNHMINNVREIDFEDFDHLIENNLGTDISQEISNITISRFGIS